MLKDFEVKVSIHGLGTIGGYQQNGELWLKYDDVSRVLFQKNPDLIDYYDIEPYSTNLIKKEDICGIGSAQRISDEIHDIPEPSTNYDVCISEEEFYYLLLVSTANIGYDPRNYLVCHFMEPMRERFLESQQHHTFIFEKVLTSKSALNMIQGGGRE